MRAPRARRPPTLTSLRALFSLSLSFSHPSTLALSLSLSRRATGRAHSASPTMTSTRRQWDRALKSTAPFLALFVACVVAQV